jgi:hypothetical protein
MKIDHLQKSKDVHVLELEKLKNERSKHANEKKLEIEKLRSELEKVKNQKKDRAKILEKESAANLENLKKEHTNKVFLYEFFLLIFFFSMAKIFNKIVFFKKI